MKCTACQAENPDGSERCASCGWLLAGTSVLTIGSVLAQRYQIQAILGRGGMGMVYKAHDRVLDETVALKVLLADVAGAADMAQRFRSEIKLARKVRHRNVCGIHEYGEEGSLRYITMELIDGTDLKRTLQQRGALPPVEAFGITIQLCEGLQAIHDVGVVHRDLKTSNVMIDRKGYVRLMDFGIAKQLGLGENNPAATAVGHILGTPEYMSPEQARGTQIDHRSDIYAMGVVVYEIFTGNVPFHGNTPIATLFKQLEEPLRIEGPVAAMLPGAIIPVLNKALAKEPNERYQTARELALALEDARARALPSAPPTQALDRGTDPTLRTTTQPTLAGGEPATMVVQKTIPKATPPTPRPTPPPPPPQRPPTSETRTELRPTPPSLRTKPERAPVEPPAPKRSVVPWLVMFAVAFLVASIGAIVGLKAWLGRDKTDVAQVSPSIADVPPSVTTTMMTPTPSLTTSTTTATTSTTTFATTTTTLPMTTTTTLPPRTLPTPTPPLPTPRPPVTTQPSSRERAELITPPSLTPVPEQTGTLQMRVVPWADVSVDGNPVGQTPIKPLRLASGPHTIRLSHPEFKPLTKKVTLRPGETVKLEVDLAQEAFPK
jgi:serine/threonine protein kinase